MRHFVRLGFEVNESGSRYQENEGYGKVIQALPNRDGDDDNDDDRG